MMFFSDLKAMAKVTFAILLLRKKGGKQSLDERLGRQDNFMVDRLYKVDGDIAIEEANAPK